MKPWRRALGAIGLLIGAAGLLVVAGVPILYASALSMGLGSLGVLGVRPDLRAPSVGGALVSVGIYLALCLVFEQLVPGVFERTWRPSLLLRGHFLGVPLDELLYGGGAGLMATAFPAWALGFGYAPLPPR